MTDLNQKVQLLESQLKAANANLQAHQQMLNEALANRLQIHTQMIMLQGQLKESSEALQKLKAENDEVLKKNTALDAEVTALKAAAAPAPESQAA